jgi:hypothetical protein
MRLKNNKIIDEVNIKPSFGNNKNVLEKHLKHALIKLIIARGEFYEKKQSTRIYC